MAALLASAYYYLLDSSVCGGVRHSVRLWQKHYTGLEAAGGRTTGNDLIRVQSRFTSVDEFKNTTTSETRLKGIPLSGLIPSGLCIGLV